MSPSDEELLHAFYAGDNAAIERLVERHDPLLRRIAYLILEARTGSQLQARGEWDVRERLERMWTQVLMTREAALASWPHQRLSALTWLIYLLCLEMDRHLGFRPPF
jgi:hypothetical protein